MLREPAMMAKPHGSDGEANAFEAITSDRAHSSITTQELP